MTSADSFTRKAKHLWLSTWPFWTLLVFAGLAAVRLLPAGYHAAVAAPVLFMVPGSLTLGAVFSTRRAPRGAAFVCYAALLSAIWSVFASLALYALNVRITADSTYQCLLVVSAVLAIVAEARLLLGRPGKGRRVTRKPETMDPDLSDAEVRDAKRPAAAKETAYYAIAALVVGVEPSHWRVVHLRSPSASSSHRLHLDSLDSSAA